MTPSDKSNRSLRSMLRAWWVVPLALLPFHPDAAAATLTAQTNIIGATPSILAYNLAHFYSGSNARDWWRYSGVNGARIFLSPSEIEASDDISGVGDGVTNQFSFLIRRAAIRTNQLNSSYINWSYISNRYESNDLYPNNHILPNYALTQLRALSIQPVLQITASQSRFPIADTNDWANMWELWQHYYFQAFYLGRVFDVDRYQMFNEPNHSNANGLTITNHLLRLQLASDAIQLAIADVNSLYSKSLSPKVFAPVAAGSADGSYSGWGESVVTNRHKNFLGQTDTNFNLIHVYDYHQYGSSPSGFGSDLANLNGFLTADMSPEPRYPTSISEFNTHTGADFDGLSETMDSATEYSRFASIALNLMSNSCSELYAFKFGHTINTSSTATNYPVQKNAMHYLDNTNSPYQVGGINKAGEVWRLFNKAFAPGRNRLSVSRGSGATSLDVQASRDLNAKRFYLFSANYTASTVALDIDLAGWNIPTGNRVLIEEVSESNYGTAKFWTNLHSSKIVSGIQPAYSVWLLTVSTNLPQSEQNLTASDDTEVRDGANKGNNYGSASTMTVRNDPATADNRRAALIRFQLPTNNLVSLELALLSVTASSATVNTAAQAHVYGITNISWSQSTIVWSNAPNLRDGVAAGKTIARNVIEGHGTNAFILGQLVTTSTTASEKLLDVTAYVRAITNSAASFLISQDPRWDVTLPSLAAGDTQPDGISISSREGGNAPRLKLVYNAAEPPNTPPVATNDSYITLEDTPLTIDSLGVLTNDFDAESDPLTSLLVSNVSHGSLTLGSNGSFTYTPATNYFGSDSFTYKVNDGLTDSAPATVSLTTTAVNDPPLAQNDSVITTQNVAVTVSVPANDSDVDGGTVTLVSFTQPVSGGVSNNGNGTLTYTPGLNFTGVDSFGYTITDNQGGTNSAIVNVTVIGTNTFSVWTNVLVATEANIRGGVNANLNVDEVTQGYLMVKYNASPFDSARKVYFQFDLTALNVNANTSATLRVTTHTTTFRHRAQLWGLKQDYSTFSSGITWNTAQANETNSNNLFTNGTFFAEAIGTPVLFSNAASTAYDFSITRIGDFAFNGKAVFAFTGADDPTNDAGGLRLGRTNAVLTVLISEAVRTQPLITSITSTSNSLVLRFLGGPGETYRVQRTTNLTLNAWSSISTNVADSNGVWTVVEGTTPPPVRFYRAVTP